MVLRMVSSDTSAVVLKISSRAAIGFGARSHKRERRKDGEIDRTRRASRPRVSTFSSKAKMHEILAFILFAGGTDVSVNRDETGENEDREKSGGKVDKGS